jgi:uncharacterized protein
LALVLDSGVLLAALDGADPDHEECAELIGETKEQRVVPALVLSEVDYWCHKRLGADVWLGFLEDILDGVYTVENLTRADLERCQELQSTYADLQIGVVDASVFALVERLDETKVATLDTRHFATMRPLHVPALTLLPV